MYITALCPTYRHPTLLANSLALWQMQDYPADSRFLLILDDSQTFSDQHGDNWRLVSAAERFPSLPDKYNWLLAHAPEKSEAFLVWEDDDVYFPGYVSGHVEQLRNHEFSKPRRILTDYGGTVHEQDGWVGAFHSSMAFQKGLIERIGGWVMSKRADFDQQLIAKLRGNAKSEGVPLGLDFMYSWHTGAAHCQSSMKAPGDETWYDRAPEHYEPVEFVGQLIPEIDQRTRQAFAVLGRELSWTTPPIRP